MCASCRVGTAEQQRRGEEPAAPTLIQSRATKCQGPVKKQKEGGKKKERPTHERAHTRTHEKDELIEVSISMATQNSFDDVPSQSAGRVWPNHGTDWCSVACY